MIESISAITLATHNMSRAISFYRMLGFEIVHGGDDALSIAFSSPSAPPSLAVWGSGSRFAVRSSKRMADNCGRPRNNPAALYFNSGYLSIQTLHRDWPSGWSLYLRDKTASTVATVHFRV